METLTPKTKEQKEQQDKEYEARRKLEMTNWEDLTIEQKIERMKDIVKTNGNTALRASREVKQIKEDFSEHLHKDGKIWVEYKKYGRGSGMGVCESAVRAENYF